MKLERTLESMTKAARVLRGGGIGVLPTDTLYGFVASALSPDAVNRLYRVRGRNEKKPCIVLIEKFSDMETFGVALPQNVENVLRTVWPGAVSIVFPNIHDRFSYLHRGMGTLAFRIPDPIWLRNFLHETGPIIAPSANLEGMKPAETIEDAKAYFGDRADFFVNGGKLSGLPSTVVRLEDDRFTVIRPGAGRF